MSTNYYLDFDPYDRESEKLHIGKSFRMFQGYVEPHFFNGRYVPRLVSWEDWKHYLAATIVDDPEAEAVIRAEHGATIDFSEFVEVVENTPVHLRRKQFNALNLLVNSSPVFIPPMTLGKVVAGGDWLDSRGYSFHGGEFS